MNSKGVLVLFAVILCISLYVLMGYRAQHALERAVCGATREEYLGDYTCLKLRKSMALDVAWWTWPWTLGRSDEVLRDNFVKHFL
jgi:hypothetical protein